MYVTQRIINGFVFVSNESIEIKRIILISGVVTLRYSHIP